MAEAYDSLINKDRTLQSLHHFFGDPSHPEKIKNYTEDHAATFHFPDAYAGSNQKLRDTLTNLITSHVQSWCTTVALPWLRVQGLEVEWDETKFDVRLLQRVPYEGISRLQTSMRRKHRERAVRRGIGMILESDFYMTPAGKKHFADNLTSINLCVQETVNFDGMWAYLTCPNHDFNYMLSRGLVNKRSILHALRGEITNYAIVQKDERGFDRSVEMAKDSMMRYHVEPDMLIVPPQMLLYLTTVPEAKINYSIGGQKAVSDFQGGVAGFKSQSFRGLNVFTVTPFDMGEQQDTVQMLQRNTQVGEYYMLDAHGRTGAGADWCESCASVKIYNEEKDKLEEISFSKAIGYACIDNLAHYISDNSKHSFNDSGGNNVEKDAKTFKLRTLYKDPNSLGWKKTVASMTGEVVAALESNKYFQKDEAALYTELGIGDTYAPTGKWTRNRFCAPYKSGKDPTLTAASLDEKNYKLATVVAEGGDGSANIVDGVRQNYADFETTDSADVPVSMCWWLKNLDLRDPLTLPRLQEAATAGVWLPFSVCLVRPFIEHRMLSTIVTVAGNDTGCTLYGPADMQLSANTSTKVIQGHFTCHTKSIISKPENVYVQRDIMANGYVAGRNCKFFGEAEIDKTHTWNGAQHVQNAMKTRLTFGLDDNMYTNNVDYDSMLAFLVPYDAEDGLSDCSFNITARSMPWEVTAKSDDQPNKIFPGSGTLWGAYNQAYNLDRIVNAGEDMHASQTRGFISGGLRNNGVIIQGPYRTYDRVLKRWHLTPGQGHWGADNRHGDARWMRGEAIDMLTARRAVSDIWETDSIAGSRKHM